MSVVRATIDIAAPIDDVWESIIEPARIREWVTIVDKIDHVDTGAIRPGFWMD